MARLGLQLLSNGFALIPLLLLARIHNACHVAGTVLLVILNVVLLLRWRIRHGSFLSWYREPVKGRLDLHPFLVVLVGLVFLLPGLFLICFEEPGSGPDAMDRYQIVAFGVICCLLGGGLCLLALARWRATSK